MMAKRKKPSRKRTTRSKSKTKRGSGVSWTKWALALVFFGLAGLSFYLFLFRGRLLYVGSTSTWVDSVLLAAEVDLDTDKQVAVSEDGVERWMIRVPSTQKKAALLRALEKGVQNRGDAWRAGEETIRDNKRYQVVELTKENGAALRLIFEVGQPKRSSTRPAKRPSRDQPAVAEQPMPPPVAKEAEPNDNSPKIAIVLDDIGHREVDSLNSVLQLKYPITFAVLPFLANSRSCAIYFHQNRYEVILHMPMEPSGYPRNNPGKGAVLSNLNDSEIRTAVRDAIANIPFLSGVNNHMGSRITTNRVFMRTILDEVRAHDLYYLDSRTHANTVAYKTAQEMGMPSAKRDVFLDSEQSYEFALKQIREVVRIADRDGSAIAIGHPYPTTLRALAEEMPKLDAAGYRFVFASELVEQPENRL